MYLKDFNNEDIRSNDLMISSEGHVFKMKGVYCRGNDVYMLDEDRNKYNPSLCKHISE